MRRVAQLSFDDARQKAPAGPALTVLPDAARVEEHLVRRAVPFVAGRVACTLAQLERELVREARAAGACPEVASPEALAPLFRDVSRPETPRGARRWRRAARVPAERAGSDLRRHLRLDTAARPDGRRPGRAAARPGPPALVRPARPARGGGARAARVRSARGGPGRPRARAVR